MIIIMDTLLSIRPGFMCKLSLLQILSLSYLHWSHLGNRTGEISVNMNQPNKTSLIIHWLMAY